MEYNLSLQNLRYRHKQYIKLPKYKLAYNEFYHGIFLFSRQSKATFYQNVLLPKF